MLEHCHLFLFSYSAAKKVTTTLLRSSSFFSYSIAKKAMARMLSLPSSFCFVEVKKVTATFLPSPFVFFVAQKATLSSPSISFWCNKEGNDNNVVITFFFLLQCTKETDGNNDVVAFFFLIAAQKAIATSPSIFVLL